MLQTGAAAKVTARNRLQTLPVTAARRRCIYKLLTPKRNKGNGSIRAMCPAEPSLPQPSALQASLTTA